MNYFYRTIIINFILFVFVQYSYAQGGSFLNITEDINKHIPSNNIHNGHEYVDLGLSVKWATMNVGANKMDQAGNRYVWGETEPQKESSYYGDNNNNTRPNANLGNSNYRRLTNEDDAANVSWGGEWRMPTADELLELCEACTWYRGQTDSRDCVIYIGVSKVNGNAIFLPETKKYEFLYWSNERSKEYSGQAHCMFLNYTGDDYQLSNPPRVGVLSRKQSAGVRPVLP